MRLYAPEKQKRNYNAARDALIANDNMMRDYASRLEDAETPEQVTKAFRGARSEAAAAANNRHTARIALMRLAPGTCDIGDSGTVDPIFAPRFYAATAGVSTTAPSTTSANSAVSGQGSRTAPKVSQAARPKANTAKGDQKKSGHAARQNDGTRRRSHSLGQQDDAQPEKTSGDVEPPKQQVPLLPPDSGSATGGKGASTPVPSPTTPAPTTSNPPTPTPTPSQPSSPSGSPTTWAETTGGTTHTWSNYTNAGGDEGPVIQPNMTVQITCKVQGFRVADGNTWWYRIADQPWGNGFYASADAFYNNGQTSGSLRGTPFVDATVSDC